VAGRTPRWKVDQEWAHTREDGVFADADTAASKAAEVIAAAARAALAARARFIMAVSGGHSPWQMLRAPANEEPSGATSMGTLTGALNKEL
jgi:6-phosphogluconolactonase/glucosamine-6-phosphate isomerase/deaminase